MENASWELQKALYAAVQADTHIQSLFGVPARIYDDVPEDVLFPYMTIGEVRCRDWEGVDGGLEHDLRLHAWSRYGGRQ